MSGYQCTALYLRLRNAFHQVMVHDYGTDGLLRFVESFARRGFIFGGTRSQRHRRILIQLERSRMTAALDEQLVCPFDTPLTKGYHVPLRRIEIRVSVPSGRYLLHTLRAWLEGIRDHLRPATSPRVRRHSQVGLVFHLLKRGDDEQATEQALETVRRLGGILKDYPKLRPFIVGLDAAGDERCSPPRVFGQAFVYLQRLQADHRALPHEPLICLGRTYHVGEDVDDLLTGLRHVDEVASLLLGEEGGRLGHALALGESPTRFYQRRGGQTEPPLGSHLLDLVWAWGRLCDARETDHCLWLENRIRNLGFAGRTDEPQLENCYRAMVLDLSREKVLSEQELLTTLGFRGDRAQPIICRADQPWLELVDQLQCLLHRRLAYKHICIEANPTSNLIVGGYTDYGQLPYDTLVADDLALSLNTDDPGLFVTSLAGEFAAMYNAFAGRMTHRKILEWLADRCFDASQSSFLGHQAPIGVDAHALIATPKKLDSLFEYKPE